MPPHQTLIDERGYHFQFPMLGLPDRAGEWFEARMVIARKDIDDPCYLFAGPMEAPLRYASADCGAMQVESNGTVYIIPLVAPQQPYPATELFSIKVRRERATSMPKTSSCFNGGEMFFAAHPEGMAGYQPKPQPKNPTEADEKVFWQRTLSTIFNSYLSSTPAVTMYGNMFTNGSLAAERAKATLSQPANLLEWIETPADVFDKEWMKEVLNEGFRIAKHSKMPMHAKGPGMALKALGDSGEGVAFQYAMLFHDLDAPRWDEWTALPPHAFMRGRTKTFVNQAKALWEKEAGAEAQWEVYRLATLR